MDFDSYAREHSRGLLRFAFVLTNDAGLAEDVLQEVLIRAHGRWSQIADLPQPHAYVRRMVVNEFLSWRRKWGRIEPRPGDELDHRVTDQTDQLDDRGALIDEVAKLPPRQRAAIVLRYFEDLSDHEIAAALSCREVTVRGYIHRGLKALKVELSGPENSPKRNPQLKAAPPADGHPALSGKESR
ncbi:SigE family RNA polymerase sigma factor [Jatrophihabitans sp. DSM 45814]